MKGRVCYPYMTHLNSDCLECSLTTICAGLWTQVALAYAIHKSLIFIRVPLTAAITPKVVKVLRQWGWDIVKGKPKGM